MTREEMRLELVKAQLTAGYTEGIVAKADKLLDEMSVPQDVDEATLNFILQRERKRLKEILLKDIPLGFFYVERSPLDYRDRVRLRDIPQLDTLLGIEEK